MPSFSHRATSGVALLLVLGLLVGALRRFPRGHAARRWAWASFAFILGEAAVGAGLVLFELVADNKSMARALFMGTHLINTFFLLAALALTTFHAGRERDDRDGARLDSGVVAGLLGMLVVSVYTQVASVIMSPVLFLKRPTAWLDAMSRYGGTISFVTEQIPSGGQRRVEVGADGIETVTVYGGDGTVTVTTTSGTQAVSTSGPDPRFGFGAPRATGRLAARSS